MALLGEAKRVYQHLISDIVPTGRVTPYSAVSAATGVEIGIEGGHIGRVLGEVARACDENRLPPLTAIVVHANEIYDNGEHGMPGPGYFTQEADSPNVASRHGHERFARWGSRSKPDEVERWTLRDLIEQHQDSVFALSTWPHAI